MRHSVLASPTEMRIEPASEQDYVDYAGLIRWNFKMGRELGLSGCETEKVWSMGRALIPVHFPTFEARFCFGSFEPCALRTLKEFDSRVISDGHAGANFEEADGSVGAFLHSCGDGQKVIPGRSRRRRRSSITDEIQT